MSYIPIHFQPGDVPIHFHTTLADGLREAAHGQGNWKKHLAKGATLMQPNAEVISELWILQPKMGNSSFGR